MKINNNHWAPWRRALTALLAGMASTVIVACGEDVSDSAQATDNTTNTTYTNSASAATEQTGVINLLFIGHGHREGEEGGFHFSHINASLFNQALGKEKIFMDYVEDLDKLTEEGLAKVDAVMIYANYNELGEEREKLLERFVENGGAFIPVHSASACFDCTERYTRPGMKPMCTPIITMKVALC